MVVGAIIALALGIGVGLSGLKVQGVEFLVKNADYVLYLLMFLVGISVGLNRGIFKQMRGYGVRLAYITLGIVLGSILGGLLTGLVTGLSPREGAAIASGLGWYSLSGVRLSLSTTMGMPISVALAMTAFTGAVPLPRWVPSPSLVPSFK